MDCSCYLYITYGVKTSQQAKHRLRNNARCTSLFVVVVVVVVARYSCSFEQLHHCRHEHCSADQVPDIRWIPGVRPVARSDQARSYPVRQVCRRSEVCPLRCRHDQPGIHELLRTRSLRIGYMALYIGTVGSPWAAGGLAYTAK